MLIELQAGDERPVRRFEQPVSDFLYQGLARRLQSQLLLRRIAEWTGIKAAGTDVPMQSLQHLRVTPTNTAHADGYSIVSLY